MSKNAKIKKSGHSGSYSSLPSLEIGSLSVLCSEAAASVRSRGSLEHPQPQQFEKK